MEFTDFRIFDGFFGAWALGKQKYFQVGVNECREWSFIQIVSFFLRRKKTPHEMEGGDDGPGKWELRLDVAGRFEIRGFL